LELEDGEPVPATQLLPDVRWPRPLPAALLLHGFASRKEQMTESAGVALANRGVASLAIDLPLHGAREQTFQSLSLQSPLTLVNKWRRATREADAGIDYLGRRDDVDGHRLAIVGYSLGAFISVAVAAKDKRIRAIVLASGGDLPASTPFASLVRAVADPLRAVRALAGRPLLMVNGRSDRTIEPAQAERLFEAAAEPKRIIWYAGGHWPPDRVIDQAAQWLAATLNAPQKKAKEA
jgi:fermentation-respiration switch protein FrsA (DUF1100 family)